MTTCPIQLLQRAAASMRAALHRLCQRIGANIQTHRWRRQTLRQLDQRRRS